MVKVAQKICVVNNFAYVNHDNIKPQQHCHYGSVHLNTAGGKILVDNFPLVLYSNLTSICTR